MMNLTTILAEKVCENKISFKDAQEILVKYSIIKSERLLNEILYNNINFYSRN